MPMMYEKRSRSATDEPFRMVSLLSGRLYSVECTFCQGMSGLSVHEGAKSDADIGGSR